MKYLQHSIIKTGCIYYVDFEPTQKSEFNGKHLSLVLRKNDDNYTLIVLPLTSSNKGLGKGKIDLGILNCLPINLQNKTSYAVVNQVRTVNCSRLSSIKHNGKYIAPKVDNTIINTVFTAIITDMTYNVNIKIKNGTYREIFINSSVQIVNSLLYNIDKELKNKNTDENKISKLKSDILDIIAYIPYKIILEKIDDNVKSLAENLFLENINLC